MLQSISKHQKLIAWFLVSLCYAELISVPLSSRAADHSDIHHLSKTASQWRLVTKHSALAARKPEQAPGASSSNTVDKTAGPDQPEMQSYSSVTSTDMVDLFTGDFSYNIPLMDVGGYPVSLSYRGGISMDQEASWVGLGWSVNPGSINRNMRGLPDDFDGSADSIRKTTNVKTNRTVGVTAGASVELAGLPLGLGANVGLFHNNYKGWGFERGVNASINAGSAASGYLSGGLSITNNTQEGVSISPSFSLLSKQRDMDDNSSISGSFSLTLPYNSRTGLRGLQMSAGLRQYGNDNMNQKASSGGSASGEFNTTISFASPAVTPSITIPFTSEQYSFTAKTGVLQKVFDPNFFISGYVSTQFIAAEDTTLSLPSFGYLNYQNSVSNNTALLDYNMEKDLPYKEKPPVPHIAIPSYTYDAFSITGEGTGGMFRAYRGDIGVVQDHSVRTRDKSARGSIDFAGGDLVHAGVDLNINRAYSQNGPWVLNNTFRRLVDFKRDDANFEAAYFRNPGEKSVNSTGFYNAFGGDDVVAVSLYQPSKSSSQIQATNFITRYKNKRAVENKLLIADSVYRRQRDKRTQVITYLTAREAENAALSKYIDAYKENTFDLLACGVEPPTEGLGTGLPVEYFPNSRDLTGASCPGQPQSIDFPSNNPLNPAICNIGEGDYSIRWTGRLRAPATGTYILQTIADDGVRLWLNDINLVNNWKIQAPTPTDAQVNLIAGEFYDIRMEYYQKGGPRHVQLKWALPGQTASQASVIPAMYLYGAPSDSYPVGNLLVKEHRINSFRKANHISEVTVLNKDGRRYIYGIPVYNLKQKEATFAVNRSQRDDQRGLVRYSPADNSTANTNGTDHYYKAEELPAYAHSFLLTGIVSADFVDVTGNGITDDDLGDAVKFNYFKSAGIQNPLKWRTPYVRDSVNYNDGLKSDDRDDKGSLTFGEKELWYLHSIESKTMVATFIVEGRSDLRSIDERGNKINSGAAKRLKEIRLYSKADFAKSGINAKPVKAVHFEYTYELCMGINKDAAVASDSGKLTLKKVWFTYNNNKKGARNPYIFHYANNQRYQQKTYDRWGNYKDPLDNPGSVSGNVIGNDEYPYALQDSAKAAMNAAAWNLDSIILPSGGSIKVDFESDDYAFTQNKRAMQMFKIAGFAASPGLISGFSNRLYSATGDHNYIYLNLPSAVTNSTQFYNRYLQKIAKVYFRLFVRMPDDPLIGTGSEYVSGYAEIDPVNGFGISNSTTGWVKLKGISLTGDGPGVYSPMAKTAIQFLRLNLPGKAYKASEPGDNLNPATAVKLLVASFQNLATAFSSFDKIARTSNMAAVVDVNRSYLRLNAPSYKKLGGGHRVKRIKVYDNWDKMTQRRGAVYGQEYTYAVSKEIDGSPAVISSGVASYEPGIGGDENPFRQPIEYIEKSAILAPVTLGYSEEPLGESFFPAPSIGYSKVRVRTINHKNTRSANGFEETRFYTAYDYPTYTDRSLLDSDTKKRFKPALANFLRINARHHMVLSQGFRIELNDMTGKLRSKAYFAETDQNNPIVYTENLYRTENVRAEHKTLSNQVMVISPTGAIDTAATIGKDVEVMVAMREQLSINEGNNINVNADMFSVPFLPPFFVLPSVYNLYQREENLFRSAATVKVIQRYGILDSVIHIEKGSKVSTKDLLYDSETGDVLLSRTQNEFDDPVYTFTYPSHWAYDQMGLAYKNVNVVFQGVNIKDGKILGATPSNSFFSSGDEILVAGKLQTGGASCNIQFSTFPAHTKVWAIDRNVTAAGPADIYFIDRQGNPYNGNDITLKIIRSGRRNILSSVGSVTSLISPLQYNSSNQLTLLPQTSSQVIAASANEFKQLWKIEDLKYPLYDTSYIQNPCPAGYTYDAAKGICYKDTAAVISDSFSVCVMPSTNPAYSSCGSYFYSFFLPDFDSFARNRIDPINNFWINSANQCAHCNYEPVTNYYDNGNALRSANKALKDSSDTLNAARLEMSALACTSNPSNATGPLNRAGVWACPSTPVPANEYFGFTVPVTIPHNGTYFIGMAADNAIKVHIDGQLFRQNRVESNQENFKIWHIYPKFFTAGYHSVRIEAKDLGQARVVGLEIYDNTEAQIRAATSYSNLNLIFSTKDLPGQTFPSSYTCPADYQLAKNGSGNFVCRISQPSVIDTLTSSTCLSVVTDTAINPYVSGLLGNWRSHKKFSYYGRRAESDPMFATNIRRDGTFQDFAPLWNFVFGRLSPIYNETRWVWNSESTQFNKKGFEIESKDALGRFTSGNYGYSNSMPVTVVQNSRYRESAFESFEDYSFQTQICDTACSAMRQLDFTNYRNLIDNSVSHSGRHSIRISAGEQATLQFPVSDTTVDSLTPALNFTTGTACGSTILQDIKVTQAALLPIFAPLKGRKMVVSAWVKEQQDCKAAAYSGNSIIVAFDNTSVTFSPTGNIIEGWQRYEGLFDVPLSTSTIAVSLRATSGSAVYFDDLRLHPFNGNMKSFVFDPQNMRLMAELDENNYATFYEYDDDGTLTRLKKETERGVKTIKETRSALLKEQ